ncbi:MAG: hypothetical protein WAN30_09375 [Acidimicrobiales bacterium]
MVQSSLIDDDYLNVIGGDEWIFLVALRVRGRTVVVRKIDGSLRGSLHGGDLWFLAEFAYELEEWSSEETGNPVSNGVLAQHSPDNSLEDIALHETNRAVKLRPTAFNVPIREDFGGIGVIASKGGHVVDLSFTRYLEAYEEGRHRMYLRVAS